MGLGAAIALGAVIGLALGIVVSVATEIPLAPEVGAVLGALADRTILSASRSSIRTSRPIGSACTGSGAGDC
jgi:hypothetical protein